MNTCIQCGSDAPDQFCQNCGQPQEIARLTIKSLLSDFASRIYGLDGTFPRTVIGMTIHPGVVVREFVSGIRRKYVGPVGYYFLMFAIFLLIAKLSGSTLLDYYPNSGDMAESISEYTGEKPSDKAAEMSSIVQTKITDNMQYFMVLMIPFIALWGRIIFRKSGYNMTEGSAQAFYTFGQINIINIIGFIIFTISGYKNIFITGLISFVYFAWSINQFYSGKNTIKSYLKSVVTYGLSYLSFIIFSMLIGVLLAIFGKDLFA